MGRASVLIARETQTHTTHRGTAMPLLAAACCCSTDRNGMKQHGSHTRFAVGRSRAARFPYLYVYLYMPSEEFHVCKLRRYTNAREHRFLLTKCSRSTYTHAHTQAADCVFRIYSAITRGIQSKRQRKHIQHIGVRGNRLQNMIHKRTV